MISTRCSSSCHEGWRSLSVQMDHRHYRRIILRVKAVFIVQVGELQSNIDLFLSCAFQNECQRTNVERVVLESQQNQQRLIRSSDARVSSSETPVIRTTLFNKPPLEHETRRSSSRVCWYALQIGTGVTRSRTWQRRMLQDVTLLRLLNCGNAF